MPEEDGTIEPCAAILPGVEIPTIGWFSRTGGQPGRPDRIEAPIIEHDVRIGQDVLPARGITLGTGCVIGAGAVVTGSVPPRAVMGGNPARLIRCRLPEDIASRLLGSAWWNHEVSDFAVLRHDDPVAFIGQPEQAADAGSIAPVRPERLVLGRRFGTA